MAVPETALRVTFPADAVAEPVRLQLDDAAPDAPTRPLRDAPTAEGTLNGPVVAAWELTATTVAGTEVTTFTQPLTLTVQLAPYLEALTQQPGSPGLLWLNETTGAWEIVPSQVNWQVGTVTAAVTHFSTYGVGATDTLSYGAQYLPTVRGFSTDEWSGNSSINYPLTLPPGPGGLNLPLRLNYSSEGVNSLRQGPSERSDIFHTQAGFAGWGWSIGGLGSITYSNGEYHLTYPGGTTRLVRPGNEGNVYQTVPQSFARIERVPSGNALWLDHWHVWSPDGTRYTFGTQLSNKGFAWNNARNDANLECWRFLREAHLTEVLDTYGNRVTIEYTAEREGVPSGFCRPDTAIEAREYVRAIYPNYLEYIPAGAGASSTVRVTFEPEARDDWNVEHHDNDFVQAYWADKRLKQVLVEVRGAAGWEPVRSYVLDYDERWLDYNNHKGLSLLISVTERGRANGALPSWTFGYDQSGAFNHTLLNRASNGQGGEATYQYHEVWPIAMQGCEGSTRRFRVQQQTISDGLGTGAAHQTHTFYDPTNDHWEAYAWNPGCTNFEFGGFRYVKRVLKDGAGSVVQSTVTRYLQRFGTIGNSRDARVGRPYQHITYNAAGTEMGRVETAWQVANNGDTRGVEWVYKAHETTTPAGGVGQRTAYY